MKLFLILPSCFVPCLDATKSRSFLDKHLHKTNVQVMSWDVTGPGFGMGGWTHDLRYDLVKRSLEKNMGRDTIVALQEVSSTNSKLLADFFEEKNYEFLLDEKMGQTTELPSLGQKVNMGKVQ